MVEPLVPASPEAHRNWIFLGEDFDEFLHSALCLVRLWTNALRQFTELVKKLTLFLHGALWWMTSRLSPYSALSLVRQRIHAMR